MCKYIVDYDTSIGAYSVVESANAVKCVSKLLTIHTMIHQLELIVLLNLLLM